MFETTHEITEIGEGWIGFVYTFKIPSEDFTAEFINSIKPAVWKRFANWCSDNHEGEVTDVCFIVKKKDGYCTIAMKWHPVSKYVILDVENITTLSEIS